MGNDNSQAVNQATQLVNLMQAKEEIVNILPTAVELAQYHAQLLFKKYTALKKEGFTDEQALEIICKRPLIELI